MKLKVELFLLYNFLLNPSSYSINQNKNYRQILYLLFRLYIIEILLSVLFMSIFIYLADSRADFISNFKAKSAGIRPVIILVILVPLIEELIFRLPLIFRPVFLGLSTGTFSYMLLPKIFDGIELLKTDYSNYIAFSLACIVGYIAYVISSKKETSVRSFYKRNYNLIVWLSILSFGFLHILNFDLSTKNLLLLPFFTLPQLVAGTVLSFIRLRFGFVYAICYHALQNLLVALI